MQLRPGPDDPMPVSLDRAFVSVEGIPRQIAGNRNRHQSVEEVVKRSAT